MTEGQAAPDGETPRRADGSVRRSRREWTLNTLDRAVVYRLAWSPELRAWTVDPPPPPRSVSQPAAPASRHEIGQ